MRGTRLVSCGYWTATAAVLLAGAAVAPIGYAAGTRAGRELPSEVHSEATARARARLQAMKAHMEALPPSQQAFVEALDSDSDFLEAFGLILMNPAGREATKRFAAGCWRHGLKRLALMTVKNYAAAHPELPKEKIEAVAVNAALEAGDQKALSEATREISRTLSSHPWSRRWWRLAYKARLAAPARVAAGSARRGDGAPRLRAERCAASRCERRLGATVTAMVALQRAPDPGLQISLARALGLSAEKLKSACTGNPLEASTALAQALGMIPVSLPGPRASSCRLEAGPRYISCLTHGTRRILPWLRPGKEGASSSMRLGALDAAALGGARLRKACGSRNPDVAFEAARLLLSLARRLDDSEEKAAASVVSRNWNEEDGTALLCYVLERLRRREVSKDGLMPVLERLIREQTGASAAGTGGSSADPKSCRMSRARKALAALALAWLHGEEALRKEYAGKADFGMLWSLIAGEVSVSPPAGRAQGYQPDFDAARTAALLLAGSGAPGLEEALRRHALLFPRAKANLEMVERYLENIREAEAARK